MPDDYLNAWSGFAVEPAENATLIEPILAHIFEVICDREQVVYDYLVRWIAYTFQYPDKSPRVAVVMRGKKGTGKGQFATFLKKFWGNHGLAISNGDHLTGKFNSHLANCCFLFCDEAYFAADRRGEGVLKSLITEPTLLIERKGVDAQEQRNFLKIVMATNIAWCVPTSADERRYCICDVSEARMGDEAYFTALAGRMADRNAQSAFLHWALNLDLFGFKVDQAPDTKGLREQNRLSLPSEGRWLFEVLAAGELGEHCCDAVAWPVGNFVSVKAAKSSYQRFCQEQRISSYHVATDHQLKKYIKNFFEPRRMGSGYAYLFGTVAEARSKFENVARVRFDAD